MSGHRTVAIVLCIAACLCSEKFDKDRRMATMFLALALYLLGTTP